MSAVAQNLASPAVCFFLLGALAARLRSDIQLPAAAARALGFYLMVAIGFKGGVELRASGISPTFALAVTSALVLAATLPLLAYWLLVRTRSVDRINAAAVAAHYGSVSVVTFTVAVAFLDSRGEAYEGYLPALLAIMEVPAIIVAVWLAARAGARRPDDGSSLVRHACTNEAVVLLLGALLIGLITGAQGMEKLEGALVAPFHGIVALFLLEMGIVAAGRMGDFKQLPRRVIGFGIYMPLIGGALGVGLGTLIGLSPGGAMLLGVLSASASYIAAPAAMRLAVPEASPGVYLPLALGVTFPFNVALGIPLLYTAAIMIGA